MTVLNPVPRIRVTVQATQARPPRDVWKRCVLMACASSGPLLAPATYNQAGVVRSIFGEGLLARCQAIHAANDPKNTPLTVIRLPTSTPGVYRMNLADYTGGAAVAVTPNVTPLGWYQPYFEVLTGGTFGEDTTIRIRRSGDGGRTYIDVAMGTDTSIALPGLGVSIDFSVSDAELIALANDVRAKSIAHFAYTAGGVHGAADATSGAGFGAASTTKAQAITLLGTLLTGLSAHVVLTAGGVHGAADNDANAGAGLGASERLAALTAPTDEFEAVTVANELKDILNDHETHTANAIHGAVDGVNIVNAPDALAATVNAGDIIAGYTDPPRWAVASIFDDSTNPPTGAVHQARMSGVRFSMMAIAEEVLPSDAPTLTAALNYLENAGIDAMFMFPSRRRYKPVVYEDLQVTFADADPDTISRASGSWIDDGVKVGMRATVADSASNDGTYLPITNVTATVLTFGAAVEFAPEAMSNVSLLFEETEEDWGTNVASEWSSVNDQRLVRVDGEGRGSSPGSPNLDTDRPWIAEFMSTVIIDPIDVEVGQVKPLGGGVGGLIAPGLRFRIYESTTKIHYDADTNEAIPAARGTALRRHQNDQQPYCNRAITLASPTDKLDTVVKLRLANEWKRIARSGFTEELLLGQFADAQDPNRLSQAAVNSINSNVMALMRPAFTGKVSNLDSLPPNAFVATDPESDLSTGFIRIAGKIITKFYPEGFDITLDVAQPGQV